MQGMDFTVPKEKSSPAIRNESKETNVTGRFQDEFYKAFIAYFHYFCSCLIEFYGETNPDRCCKLRTVGFYFQDFRQVLSKEKKQKRNEERRGKMEKKRNDKRKVYLMVLLFESAAMTLTVKTISYIAYNKATINILFYCMYNF